MVGRGLSLSGRIDDEAFVLVIMASMDVAPHQQSPSSSPYHCFKKVLIVGTSEQFAVALAVFLSDHGLSNLVTLSIHRR